MLSEQLLPYDTLLVRVHGCAGLAAKVPGEEAAVDRDAVDPELHGGVDAALKLALQDLGTDLKYEE